MEKVLSGQAGLSYILKKEKYVAYWVSNPGPWNTIRHRASNAIVNALLNNRREY
jgi:hypothetical protein